jgi:hypothetical protein
MKKMIGLLCLSAACGLMIESTPASADTAPTPPSPYCGADIRLKSFKGDYLHRPDTAQGVTSWGTGVGNVWTLECKNGKAMLKSFKGDYLHRPDTAQGVTSWGTGPGNEWTLEHSGGKVKLKSFKGDYLHRPDTAQGVTSWGAGVGNEWTLESVPVKP